ncbi:MAG: transposase [Chthoniobacteraceae bacterium]
MRTSSGAEQLNQEIKRRTPCRPHLSATESPLRLVSAVLNEIDDDWAASKTYLNMNPPSQLQAA